MDQFEDSEGKTRSALNLLARKSTPEKENPPRGDSLCTPPGLRRLANLPPGNFETLQRPRGESGEGLA